MEVSKQAAAQIATARMAYTLKQASEAGAGCLTKLYEAIGSGELKARKRGRSTVILHDDLQRFLQSLPAYQAPGRPVAPRDGRQRAA